MGQILYDFFIKAGELGGVKARTKLSILTQTTSIQASTIEDTEENIVLFEEAMKSIIGEFKGSISYGSSIKTSDLNNDTANALRNQMFIIADLLSQRELFIDNLTATLNRITESIVQAIEVERGSIWLFNEDKSGITCVDLFIKSTNKHTAGSFFEKKDFPIYFKAVESEKTITSHDVTKDPRITELANNYWSPLDIQASLDVPFWAHNDLKGVVCFEHVGSKRMWTTDEENFGYIVGCIIAVVVENNKKEFKSRIS